jgi:hypothetical protein
MSGGILVLTVIIVLSFGIVVAVMYYGTQPDVDAGHHAESRAVAYWTARAERETARRQAAVQGAVESSGGAAAAAGDEAEKERKRQEALARKAARAAKSTGGE